MNMENIVFMDALFSPNKASAGMLLFDVNTLYFSSDVKILARDVKDKIIFYSGRDECVIYNYKI